MVFISSTVHPDFQTLGCGKSFRVNITSLDEVLKNIQDTIRSLTEWTTTASGILQKLMASGIERFNSYSLYIGFHRIPISPYGNVLAPNHHSIGEEQQTSGWSLTSYWLHTNLKVYTWKSNSLKRHLQSHLIRWVQAAINRTDLFQKEKIFLLRAALELVAVEPLQKIYLMK